MEAATNLHGEAEQTANQSRSAAIALPSTVSALMDQKKTSNQRTLNDHVEAIHLSLYEDEKYRGFIDTVYNEQAVEGSLMADDFQAATMIREKAKEVGDASVFHQNLATLVKSLSVVLRRYGISRKERREALVGGGFVPHF